MSAIDVSKLLAQPVRQHLGGTVLEVDDESGAARLRYVPGEHLKNSVGTIFGGYLAAIVDDAAGLSAWFGGKKRRFATAQLTVKFLKPGKAGEALLAEARITLMDHRRVVVEVKLRRERDLQEAVTGTATQVFLREDAPVQISQEETGPRNY